VYNASIHSSHGRRPDSVDETNSLGVFNRLYRRLLEEKPKTPSFKEGTRVRLYVNKALFVKGEKPNFQEEICTIERVLRQRPNPVYVIRTSKGVVLKKRYYEPELSRVQPL
jgi:hypothetical protein